MNIYVGNLSYEVGNQELTTAFSRFGAVLKANVISDETGRSKGFGFVEMGTPAEAQEAISALNGTELCGRTVTVNEARPKGNSGGGGGRPGGNGGGFRDRNSRGGNDQRRWG